MHGGRTPKDDGRTAVVEVAMESVSVAIEISRKWATVQEIIASMEAILARFLFKSFACILLKFVLLQGDGIC